MRPYKHKIQYYETDKMGITHHSNYIRFMEEARTDFLEQMGWPYDKLEESGVASPVISLECKYKSPSTYADELTIEVSVEQIKGARLCIAYKMTGRDGETVCEAKSEHCFVNSAGRPIRLQRDCPELYEALKALEGK